MGKITVEVKINTFGTMLYSLNHPNTTYLQKGLIIYLLLVLNIALPRIK